MVNSYQVEKFLYITLSHGYNDVLARSYSVPHLSTDDVLGIRDEVMRTSTGLTSKTLNQKYIDKLGLSMFSTFNPVIGNGSGSGWRDRRGLFVIVLSSRHTSYTFKYFVLQGYTDYDGLHIPSSSMDPNLVFFINSITEATVNTVVDHNGENIRKFSNFKNYNVLTDYSNISNGSLQLVRPMDVMGDISTHKYLERRNSNSRSLGSSNSFYSQSNHPLALRDDQNTMNYFKNILNSYGHVYKYGVMAESYGINNPIYGIENKEDIANQASTYLDVPNSNDNEILNYLKHASQSGLRNIGVYTYDDLCMILPGLDGMRIDIEGTTGDVTVEEMREKESLMEDKNGLIHAMHTDSYLGTQDEDGKPIYKIIADFNNSITYALSAYCLAGLKCFIRGTIHNGYPNFTVIPQDGNTFLDSNAIPDMTNKLVSMLHIDILPRLSYALSEGFEIMMDVSIYMDNRYAIKLLDSNVELVFKYPTFADSLYNPVITSKDNRTELINSLETITNTIESTEAGEVSYPGYDINIDY